jgi:hypothetical protein
MTCAAVSRGYRSVIPPRSAMVPARRYVCGSEERRVRVKATPGPQRADQRDPVGPWLADRGFGKPTQTEVRFSGDGGVTVNELATTCSREELELMIEDVRERIRQRGGDPDAENGR